MLDAVLAYRTRDEAGVVARNRGPLEVGERPLGGRDPQRVRVPLAGERHEGAARLEEAQGVTHHLIHGPLELERVGQDVGELLEGEQLREPPVELARGVTPLPLAAVESRQQVPERPAETEESRAAKGEEEGMRRGSHYGFCFACARASTRARSWSSTRAARLQESLVRPS